MTNQSQDEKIEFPTGECDCGADLYADEQVCKWCVKDEHDEREMMGDFDEW